MDILKYKTVTGSDGATSVSTGGLSLAQIIKISRQGEQKDFGGLVLISTLNGSNWTYLPIGKRISFGTLFPFIGSEVVHIIYKVSV